MKRVIGIAGASGTPLREFPMVDSESCKIERKDAPRWQGVKAGNAIWFL
jgi:hypothetical protein